jgi:hypothetical protein
MCQGIAGPTSKRPFRAKCIVLWMQKVYSSETKQPALSSHNEGDGMIARRRGAGTLEYYRVERRGLYLSKYIRM